MKPSHDYLTQSPYEIRCEWGAQGVVHLAACCDAIVIVDILSFTTAVSVAISQGAIVFPYRWRDGSQLAFAQAKRAHVAGSRFTTGYSLSPVSLLQMQAGERLVLPSPNGATLSLMTGQTPTYAGCFRNAPAVAQAAQQHGPKIGVIPCGERWPDETLRPCLEDLWGAGAMIAHLQGVRSPEAQMAELSFEAVRTQLFEQVLACVSGQELRVRQAERDVQLACVYGVDLGVPRLRDGAYIHDENILRID